VVADVLGASEMAIHPMTIIMRTSLNSTYSVYLYFVKTPIKPKKYAR
jgi:hypothetical protein